MNKRTEEKLKSIEGMKKAMTEILAQAWERGHKMGMLQAQEAQCWIPVKTRKMTAEEIEELSKTNDLIDADDIDQWCYCCKLPDDKQDVLITTEYGDIRFTTFYVDEYYGCYFEDYEDRDDVLAWMPLPEPYKKEETT